MIKHDNKVVYKLLHQQKHSTFDVSKFSIVGTPTITDKGVLSGTATSSYVTADIGTVSTYNTLVIDCGEIEVPDFSTNQWFYFQKQSIGGIESGFIIMFNTDGKLRYFLGSGASNWDIANGKIGNITYSANTKIKVRLVYNGDIYTVYTSVNGADWVVDSTVTSSLLIALPSPVRIGSDGYLGVLGTLDLKQVSIKIDGSPVFSGNKTGIDTIKPDNYTVDGTLTITDDGIATGFDGSNYFSTSVNLSSAWEATFSFKLIELESINVFPLLFYSSYNRMGVHKDKYIVIFVDENNTTDHHVSLFVESAPFKVGVNYLLTVKFDGTSTYSGVLVDLDNNVTYRDSQSLAYKFPSVSAWNLYRAPFTAVDLNLTKIYVDGNLVYQPCLKIPYTKSDIGNKIVDAVYESRLEDTENKYFLIDEQNETYSFPKGNLYDKVTELLS